MSIFPSFRCKKCNEIFQQSYISGLTCPKCGSKKITPISETEFAADYLKKYGSIKKK